MKLSMDEIRRLDPKDIGSWPIPIQLAILCIATILVVVLGYFLVLQDQSDVLTQGRQKEDELKAAYLDKKHKAINLDAYKEQLNDIQLAFGALLKQLPSKSEMESLITEVSQSGVGRGLEFDLFKPDPNESKTSEFAERPIDITVVGTYHDIAAFASDIAQLSRIVTLSNIDIEVTNSATGLLSLTAKAKTYRALDAEEALQVSKKKPGAAQ